MRAVLALAMLGCAPGPGGYGRGPVDMMRAVLALAMLGCAPGPGGYGRGPVDKTPHPHRPSPEAEASVVRRAEEKRARKAAARLARSRA